MQEHLNAFVEKLCRDERSPATVEKYRRDVRAFLAWLGDRSVTKDLALAWKQELVRRGYAPRSINSMVAALNSFFQFIGRTDCRVKALRIQQSVYCREEQELTKGEYLRLLTAAGDDPCLRLIMQTICATGIRVSELRYFTREAVERGEITVRCKGKTRTILIPRKLKKQLLDFGRKKGIHAGSLFVTRKGTPLDRSCIWARMKALCRVAGVAASKVFPHNLRKLFARTFYALDKDIAKLADILGHGSIETTRIYIKTTGREHRQKIERLGLVL